MLLQHAHLDQIVLLVPFVLPHLNVQQEIAADGQRFLIQPCSIRFLTNTQVKRHIWQMAQLLLQTWLHSTHTQVFSILGETAFLASMEHTTTQLELMDTTQTQLVPQMAAMVAFIHLFTMVLKMARQK